MAFGKIIALSLGRLKLEKNWHSIIRMLPSVYILERTIHMKSLLKNIFSAGLVVAVILLVKVGNGEKEDPLIIQNGASAGVAKKVQNLGIDGQSDMVCAILLIPKSLLPVVKQMSRHEIAKGITMLPANMAWDQGNLVARSKKIFRQNSHLQVNQNENKIRKSRKVSAETSAELKRKLRAAALLAYFLADETKTKFWQKSTRQID